MTERPDGWTELQWRSHRLREALARWDAPNSRALYLDRGMALAENARALLLALDGCTCSPVAGSHRPGCAWAMSR